MPRGDGTGPIGTGPMTGRAIGRCAGYQTPGYANPASAWGFGGCGRGGGRGWRNWFRATGLTRWARRGYPAPGATGSSSAADVESNEVEALRQQAQSLERSIGEIRARIEELESTSKGST
ncbi:MAG: DUF5320 domain-containing protein [Phycisphaerae bacterium]|nr:DUF5320 domain-containing protein [Phycisphaerae bacterium]